MKKATKVSLVAALAVSALTPAMAIGAETNHAAPGFYNVDNGKVVTADAFVLLSNTEKVNLLQNSNVYYADGAGKVVQATKIIDSKTDAALVAALFPETELEADKNVTLTPEGTVVPGETTALKVESVKAINASEVVVKFSQPVTAATIYNDGVGTSKQLIAGILIDGAAANASQHGFLSEDGKSLTIQLNAPAAWSTGLHTIEIPATVATKDGETLGTAFTDSFRVTADTARPAITSVDKVSKFVYEVKFSEPVTTGSAVASYTYKDSTLGAVLPVTESLSDDRKTLTLKFDSATVVNEEVNVLFPALEDLTGNKATPLTKTVTIGNADKTKPTVSSIKATSSKSLQIKFSEPVKDLNETKITINGVAATSATVDAKDKTLVDVVFTPAITTSATVAITEDAAVDYSENKAVAKTQTVYFNTDKTAPTVQSQKVIVDANGNNVLVLQMSEKVELDTPVAPVLKYVDQYGVNKTVTVDVNNVALNATDDTKLEIILDTANLSGGGVPTSGAAASKVDYTFDLAKGTVKDLFGNENIKKTISFLNVATAVTTKKLALAGVPVVFNTASDRINAGAAYVEVAFADGVDPASAKNISNYSVEGATIEKVTLEDNNPTGNTAKVRLYLTEDTVELNGFYNVTVKGVKGYSSAVTVMNEATHNVEIKENVRPTLVSAIIEASTSTSTAESDIVFTFSEVIDTDTSADNDFSLYINGVEQTTATITNTLNGDNTVKVNVDVDLNQALADGKKVELRPTSTIDLADVAGNIVKFTTAIVQ